MTPEEVAVTSAATARREIGAAVALRVYWHLMIARLILDGTPPREANELCWKSYFLGPVITFIFAVAAQDESGRDQRELAMDAMYPGGSSSPPGALTPVPDRGPAKHWTTRCLRTSLADDQRLIATSWADLVEEHGPCPRAVIADTDAERITWLTHALELLATGAGDLLHCARVAHDRYLGRPARRRPPADPGWLSGELDTALNAAWAAIRGADDGQGHPLWPQPLPAARPEADGGDPYWQRDFEADAPRRDALERQQAPGHMHGRSRGVTKSPKRKRR